jgi:hypothetical protein
MHNQQYQGNVASQYQGFQRQYQPVGNVQSFYGQNQNQQQQSYHTANYRGNQAGHDAGLRGDSFSPSQQGFGGQSMSQTNYGGLSYGVRGNQQAYSANNNVGQQFGFNNAYGGSRQTGAMSMSSYGQGANPSAASYHTANYRGNQPGHDAGLRGDSFSPSQQGGFGMQQSGFGQSANYGSFSYGARGNEQAYSSVNNVSQQFGSNNAY